MTRMKLAFEGAALAALMLSATPVLASPNNAMSDSSMQATNAVMLSSVNNPKTTLASATVKDSTGQQIGQVQKVETGSNGKVSKIEVSVIPVSGPAKTVALPASNLRYDQQQNALMTTSLTASQVDAMPAISSP